MKKFYYHLLGLLAGLLLVYALPAQTVEQRVIASGGANSKAISGYDISFTVGEAVIATAGNNPACTQGFHQPSSVKDFPVVSLNLKATATNSTVLLTWTTATEVNNDWFYIERSADGIVFTTIDSVRTKAINGNSNTLLDYTYTDLQPLTPTNYYRLQLKSKTGNISYSEIAQVSFAGINWRMTIYPNPVQHTLYVIIFSDKKTNASLSFYTITGQLAGNRRIPLEQGYNKVDLPVEYLKVGTYVLSLQELSTGKRVNTKLIRQ